MAIIKCPECGRQVSDRAPICPNCGVEIAGKVTQCDNCGEYFFADEGRCPSCQNEDAPATPKKPAAPIKTPSAKPEHPHNKHTTEHTDSPKSRNTTLIVSIVIACILGGAFFYFYSSKNNEKEEKEYEIAMKNEDPLVLEAFLNNYSDINPEHVKNIKDRLALLQAGESEWFEVIRTDTRTAYTTYLDSHPNSPHHAYALNKIDSLDWVAATSVANNNSEQAMNKYLIAHPDGAHASEAKEVLTKINEAKKSTTVTTEEEEKIFSTIRKFFQSVNSKSEGGLRAVVSSALSNLFDRPETGLDAAIAYMYDQYKGNVSNINWHLDHESLSITKQPDGDGSTYRASIKARKVTDNKDGSQSEKDYAVSITIGTDGLIRNISY